MSESDELAYLRGAAELDPAYRDIEVCPCPTPGWTHHTGFHAFVAAQVERAVKAARREGAAEVAERVEALAVHRIKVGWANCTEDMVSVTELRAALRDDA